ncbi:MAG: Flp family type IVb pilin [Bryobacteraceae bacterium]
MTDKVEVSFTLWRKLQEEDGQDLVEYALLLTFLVLGAIALLYALGGSIAALLGGSINKFSNAVVAAS